MKCDVCQAFDASAGLSTCPECKLVRCDHCLYKHKPVPHPKTNALRMSAGVRAVR